MNKYIRKSLALALVLAISIISLNTGVFAASPQVINQTVEKQNITSGVVLEKYNRFTTSGWIQTNVLRVDLSNENVKVDSLINKNSVSKITTVRNLAKDSGAVAAINACFFEPSTQAAYGPVMANGEFAMASTGNNTNHTATLSIDELNNVLYEYWNTAVQLVTPTGELKKIAAYNNYNNYYNYGMYVVDSKWGSKTPGVSKTYPDWLEMIVEDGVVKEFSQNKPGVAIPQNGFVVMATNGDIQYLTSHFKVGDPVSFDFTLNVDTSKMQMALTGGTLLVKDGQVVTKFTHSAAGDSRQPRTAVGTSADGKTLIIVTVDGRKNSSVSIGMTQAELADYMKEIGSANAVNFDGGGSTTMIARTAGTTGLATVNVPSDGFERGVSASLGVFAIGPKGPVDSLLVTAYEDYDFVNSPRAFTARGLDRYLNPVNINLNDIEWSVSGVEGTFKDNTLYPTTAGEAIVTAKIGDKVVGTCPITVLSAPVKLELNYDRLNTKAGASTTLAITGWDKDGFSASIHPSVVKWGVLGNAGTVNSNVFTAGKSGTGYVSASFGGASVYCPVSISQPGLKKVIEDFNTSSMAVELSSKSVTGKYEKATNVYKSSPYSGKLTYDFTKDVNNSRTAYINLPNGGSALDSGATNLGLWVYSSDKKPVSVVAMVYDAKGGLHYKTLASKVDWTGWKYLEVSLSDVKSPSKVTKLYINQSTKQKTSGTLYFDNLTMTYSGYPDVAANKSAVNSVPKDSSNIERTVSGSDSLSFSVFGQDTAYSADKNKTQTTMLNSLASRINSFLEASVVVGSSDNLSSKLKVPLLSTTASYKSIDKNGNRLIQLNTAKGGLRLTNSSEWFWFKDQVNSFKGNNLFIFLAGSPGSFKDSQEATVFKNMLEDYQKLNPAKNVWVFYKGSSNTSYMERGVKYISTAGFDTYGFSDSNKGAAKFVTVKAKGNTVTYQFKSFN